MENRDRRDVADHLIEPHGGELVDLIVSEARAAELQAAARDWVSIDLSSRQLCDYELLVSGAFSPLRGFMGQAEYGLVCADMRLIDGTLWPIPVTLDVGEDEASLLSDGDLIALRDPEGVMLGSMRVDEVWRPNKEEEAVAVFGTT
ncbi:MAG: adenylyltransferase, partial [Acidimicrobiia bacterium]